MGKGNIQIRDKNGWGVKTYYIEYEECGGEHGKAECDCNEDFYDDLLNVIKNTIGKQIETLKTVNEVGRCIKPIYDNFQQNIYFETPYLEVIIMDNEINIAVACIPKLKPNGKSYHGIHTFTKVANKIMINLNKYYVITARTSAWTSSKPFTSKFKTFY